MKEFLKPVLPKMFSLCSVMVGFSNVGTLSLIGQIILRLLNTLLKVIKGSELIARFVLPRKVLIIVSKHQCARKTHLENSSFNLKELPIGRSAKIGSSCSSRGMITERGPYPLVAEYKEMSSIVSLPFL